MKLFISYAYSHKHSSAGRRAKLLNSKFLQNDNWEIITSNLSQNSEPNVTNHPKGSKALFEPVSYKKSPLKLLFKKVLGSVLWPDRGLLWSFKTYWMVSRKINESSAQNIQIVSLCYPFSSILLGAFLKRRFKQRLHFTAHFIDAFYLINKGNGTSFFYSPLNYLSEKFVYKHADKIILNKVKADEFKSTFSESVSKAVFVDELPGNLFSIDPKLTEPQRYFFAGSLYQNIRNPEKVLEIFSHTTDKKIIMAGNTNDCGAQFTNYKAQNLKHIGMIDHKEMEAEYSKCQFLVNIDNQDTAQQPPGKIIEYMMLQKPIVNFYKGNSVSGGLLRDNATSESSFLEIDLDCDLKENLLKINSFTNSHSQLFEVEDPFAQIKKAYNEI